MARIVVTDIDGTISDGGAPIGGVIRHLRQRKSDGLLVYVVTARSADDRASTLEWLNANDVPHDELIMNADGGDATAYKKRVAERLLRRNDIAEWIENNPETRRALADLGINVKGPSAYRAAKEGLMETRHITVDALELRETGDGRSFSGYAAVFNSPSEPLPFIETIAPGAFKRTLNSRNNVRMLLNHNPEKPLATTRSGTLRLAEDTKGLLVDATLPDTTVGRDLAVLLRERIVDSMSFGFTVPRGGDSWSTDGSTRTLTSVRLHEVSVVSFPAYPATSASVRSVDMLADRTGEDADAIADALTALESGQSLTRDQAALLEVVVGKLAPEPEPIPEPEPVAAEPAGPSLDALYKQLDLAAKAI